MLTLSLLLLGCANPPSEPILHEALPLSPSRTERRAGELILEINTSDVGVLLETHGLSLLRTLRNGNVLVRWPEGEPLEEVQERLATDHRIALSQPNYTYWPVEVPNDPLAFVQTHLFDIGAFDDLGGLTGDGVVVAVLDSGLSEGIDGFSALLPGYDFVDNDSDVSDVHDLHGTVVAGVIAQTTNNGIGLAGAAPNATILPVRVIDGVLGGDTATLVDGLDYAITEGVDIINLSLSTTREDPLLEAALSVADEHGILVVAAAGNDSTDQKNYPAAYETVLSVTATDLDGDLTDYGNYGDWVDIAAPGGTSDDLNGDGYRDAIYQEGQREGTWSVYGLTGTSFSAPQVAAAAAILIEAGLTDPEALRAALTEGARTATDSMGYTGDFNSTWPLLDIPLALDAAEDILEPEYHWGDLNRDGALDAADIDHLSYWTLHSPTDPSAEELRRMDFDCDGELGWGDRVFWVEVIMQTRLGDADLNQTIDFADFSALSMGFLSDTTSWNEEAGHLETVACDEMATPELCRTWEDGDFDGDGDVDMSDFVALANNYGFGM